MPTHTSSQVKVTSMELDIPEFDTQVWCVILKKLLNLFRPYFPCLWNTNHNKVPDIISLFIQYKLVCIIYYKIYTYMFKRRWHILLAVFETFFFFMICQFIISTCCFKKWLHRMSLYRYIIYLLNPCFYYLKPCCDETLCVCIFNFCVSTGSIS